MNWLELIAGACSVTALWTYDKNLLEKARHSILKMAFPMLWKGLSLYNRLTGGNQQKLLSNGYKVTKIEYFNFGDGYGTCGYIDSNPTDNSIKGAVRGDSDLTTIYYTFDFYKYRMIIPKGVRINFPPYPAEEIRENECQTILAATVGEKDVTSLISEYAGPKGNFYKDLGINIKPEWMIPNLDQPLTIVDCETVEHSLSLGETLNLQNSVSIEDIDHSVDHSGHSQSLIDQSAMLAILRS